MNYKKFIRDYFEYFPSEKKGILVLSLIILCWIAGLYIYSRMPVSVEDDVAFEKAVAAYYESRELAALDLGEGETVISETDRSWNLFHFDPNTLSKDSFEILGLPAKVAANIVRYRESGGQFKRPSDLSRIYSLSEGDFQQVEPFIKIPANKPEATSFYKEAYSRDRDTSARKSSNSYKRNIIVELNTADTNDLKQIFGIGSYFARKIVEHREALGGYLNMEQLLEIYNLDAEHLDKIAPHFTLDPGLVKKINLNQITLDELRKHPYFPYSLANSIIRMRESHGAYQKIEDIRRSHLMNDSIYNRIKPYLVIHD